MVNPTSRDGINYSELVGSSLSRDTSLYASDPSSTYEMHANTQLECGEGSDLISLHEPRRTGQAIGQWPDLLSFDIAYWIALRKELNAITRSSNNDDYEHLYDPRFIQGVPNEYQNQLRGEWIRLYYNNRFAYGNLYSAAHFVMFKALLQVTAWQNSRFPFQLQQDSHFLPHDAHGYEALHRESYFNYESIKAYFGSHCSDWLSEHYLDFFTDLNDQLNQQTPATFVLEYLNSKGLPCVDFICKNEQSMRMVRPAHFVEDIQHMKGDPNYLDFKAQQLAAKIANEIRSMGF